jgi:DNA-binding NarL/FixJ family response regulator
MIDESVSMEVAMDLAKTTLTALAQVCAPTGVPDCSQPCDEVRNGCITEPLPRSRQPAIRVLVADDDAIFRAGLSQLVSSNVDIAVVGEAQNDVECMNLLTKLSPDILLLDMRLPNKNGLAVLEEINFDTVPTRALVLAVAEDRDVVRAMQLGARGVLAKNSATHVMIKSIRRVHAGEIWLDNNMTSEVMKAFTQSGQSGPRGNKPLLSGREKEIVQHVAHGFRNREIGIRLLISERTVKNHLSNIFDKVGVSDRVELALCAIRHGWIETLQ